MLSQMTDEQLDTRVAMVERMIAAERDPKNLPALNRLFQALVDEQVRRELA